MAEININIEALEQKIEKLQTLKEECDNVSIWNEDVVGSGQSTGLVRDIRCEYKTIKDTISLLISNSISFFNGVKESAVSADSESANKLSK